MVKRIIVVLTLFISIASFAQKNNTSAYSFFGIGDKNNGNTVEQLGMGGAGVSLNDVYHLNLSNPAANSALRFTTYSLAIENKNTWAKDTENKQSAATTYLSYLAFGIPLGEKGGFTFGLLPNTSVGYSLVANTYDTEGNVVEGSMYEGNGGTNKVFLGLGYEVLKGLSLGFQGNYIFGKIENSTVNQVKNVSLASKYETISNVNSFALNAGFLYKTAISKKMDLHLGGNFDLENDLNANGKEYLYSLSLGSTQISRDTILNVESKGTLSSPIKTTLGVGLGKENKWYAGIDYSFQNALNLQGNTFSKYSKISYANYSRVSIGGFYTPKFNSIASYWERATYRAGVKIEKTGLALDASGNGNYFTPLNDFGISFGVGLPVGKQLSNLNVGFDFGKRGNTSKGLVQENYFNFRLGLSLNDKWFNKLEIF